MDAYPRARAAGTPRRSGGPARGRSRGPRIPPRHAAGPRARAPPGASPNRARASAPRSARRRRRAAPGSRHRRSSSSGTPPTAVAITGTPYAIASTRATLSPSCTPLSSAAPRSPLACSRYSRISSAVRDGAQESDPVTQPRSPMRRSIAARSGPSPASQSSNGIPRADAAAPPHRAGARGLYTGTSRAGQSTTGTARGGMSPIGRRGERDAHVQHHRPGEGIRRDQRPAPSRASRGR